MSTLRAGFKQRGIEELEKVLPCFGLTAFDADDSDAPKRHLVYTSDVNSAFTTASGM